MPLERHIDDFDGRRRYQVLAFGREAPESLQVSHEALRDLADRVYFGGTDEKIFQAYRELIEQVASDAYEHGDKR